MPGPCQAMGTFMAIPTLPRRETGLPNVATNKLAVSHSLDGVLTKTFQRSLVVLSQLPYPTLFTQLISTLGPAFLTHGGPMLEAACHNIANWYTSRFSSWA